MNGVLPKLVQAKVLQLKALWSFVRLVQDPNRLDEVFEIADALSEIHPEEMRKMANHFRQVETGHKALSERPRLGRLSLDELATYPKGSLAYEFAAHMRRNGLDPAALPSLESPDELSYLRAHLYETHDLWHVLTGFDTDVSGEIGLQAFYVAQTNGPLPRVLVTIGFVNAALLQKHDFDHRTAEVARGFELGKRAKSLFGVRWNELWEVPLAEVQARFDLAPRPREATTQAEARPTTLTS